MWPRELLPPKRFELQSARSRRILTTGARVAKIAVGVAHSTSEAMKKPGESGREIGNVIKVITSIAQQTSLLAFNSTSHERLPSFENRGRTPPDLEPDGTCLRFLGRAITHLWRISVTLYRVAENLVRSIVYIQSIQPRFPGGRYSAPRKSRIRSAHSIF